MPMVETDPNTRLLLWLQCDLQMNVVFLQRKRWKRNFKNLKHGKDRWNRFEGQKRWKEVKWKNMFFKDSHTKNLLLFFQICNEHENKADFQNLLTFNFHCFCDKKRRKKNKTNSVPGLWKAKEPRKNVFKQIHERKQSFSKRIHLTKKGKQRFQKIKPSILAEQKNSYNFNKNTFFENLEKLLLEADRWNRYQDEKSEKKSSAKNEKPLSWSIKNLVPFVSTLFLFDMKNGAQSLSIWKKTSSVVLKSCQQKQLRKSQTWKRSLK